MRPFQHITVFLLLLLSAINLPFSATFAAADVLKWLPVDIPAEGKPGNWALAKNSDVRLAAQATDGAIYCYANPAGTSYTLFKSTDGGYSWSETGKVTDVITAIATLPDNADTVYYATASCVYRSRDAGNTFTIIALNPGGAGSNNIAITCLDVVSTGAGNLVAIGTRDSDNLQHGGVYLLDESEAFIIRDTAAGNYDVYAVYFSPNFTQDRQMLAVVTDESSTFVTTRLGNEPWDRNTGRATIAGLKPVSAMLAFPQDYQAEPGSSLNTVFLAVDSGAGSGDVFKIEGRRAPASSGVRDLNAGSSSGYGDIDISGLALRGGAGNAVLAAGAAAASQVYISDNGGLIWRASAKPPTGGSLTGVFYSRDYVRDNSIFCFTSGAESAFSASRDGGVTWNQTSLIDTAIGSIKTLAVSPAYSRDNTLFLITFGGEYSFWRTVNGGISWERTWSSTPTYIDTLEKVHVSPLYAESHVLYLYGASNSNPALWKSTDSGQTFIRLATRDPVTGGTFAVDTWTFAGDFTLFIGSYDGSNGVVYRSDNGGASFASRAIAGTLPVYSIALSPGYREDKTILMGNTGGEVYLSADNGISFTTLPPKASAAPLTDSISVAFDPVYSRNKTVYAASSGAGKGVYRFITSRSTEWEGIDSSLPGGGKISQLLTAPDGTLYAVNCQKVKTAAGEGGIERSLNPTYSLGPKFETVISGLKDNTILDGLWSGGNRLWTIDTAANRVMTYSDTLTVPVVLSSPENRAAGAGIGNTVIDWQALDGATTYHWQLDYDTNFTGIPTGCEDDTAATSARLPALAPDTVYYWRVRATAPVTSPWSEKWTFATSLGAELAACKLSSPEPAEKDVPLQPVFQWSALAGAERYELLVSPESSFLSPIVLKNGEYAIPATAWQCDISLNPGTTYFWKIRAISSDTHSPWSAVSAFTTGQPAQPAATEASPATVPQPPVSSVAKPATDPIIQQPLPTMTVTVTPPVMPLPQAPGGGSQPEWIHWLFFMGGAFLFMMFSFLILMIVITVRLFRG